MTTTVQTIGDQALQIIGQLRTGRTSAPEEQSEYLQILNDILDQFNAEHLKIYEVTRNAYPTVGEAQQYGMGNVLPAIFWTFVRPARIERLSLLLDGQEDAIAILTAEEWAQISLKDSSSSMPLVCWIEYEFDFINLYFAPIPSTNAPQIVVYAWEPLTTPFSSVSSPVNFPPAYEQLLEYALALKLAARYRAGIRSDWIMARDAALAAVERMNAENVTGWLEAA